MILTIAGILAGFGLIAISLCMKAEKNQLQRLDGMMLTAQKGGETEAELDAIARNLAENHLSPNGAILGIACLALLAFSIALVVYQGGPVWATMKQISLGIGIVGLFIAVFPISLLGTWTTKPFRPSLK